MGTKEQLRSSTEKTPGLPKPLSGREKDLELAERLHGWSHEAEDPEAAERYMGETVRYVRQGEGYDEKAFFRMLSDLTTLWPSWPKFAFRDL